MAKPRKRKQTLTVRLTEQEKERIQTQAKKARRSVTRLPGGPVLGRHPSAWGRTPVPLLVELKRMGSNVNQIAPEGKRRGFHLLQLPRVVDQLGALHEELCRLTRSSPWQR